LLKYFIRKKLYGKKLTINISVKIISKNNPLIIYSIEYK